MRLTKLTEGVVDREIEDAHVNLRVNALVIGIMEEDDVHGDVVKELEHLGGGIGQEVSKNGLAFRKVLV
jgi:hypothetical protein